MRACRVCRKPVTPWRRGWRRPTTTIHLECLLAKCLFCRTTFTVGKERHGLYCCNAHQFAHKNARMDAIAVTL
jgi:hypothetical protein